MPVVCRGWEDVARGGVERDFGCVSHFVLKPNAPQRELRNEHGVVVRAHILKTNRQTFHTERERGREGERDRHTIQRGREGERDKQTDIPYGYEETEEDEGGEGKKKNEREREREKEKEREI